MGWSDLDPDRIKNLPDYVKNTLPFILTRMGGVTSIMQQLTLNMVPEGMGVQTVANAFNDCRHWQYEHSKLAYYQTLQAQHGPGSLRHAFSSKPNLAASTAGNATASATTATAPSGVDAVQPPAAASDSSGSNGAQPRPATTSSQVSVDMHTSPSNLSSAQTHMFGYRYPVRTQFCCLHAAGIISLHKARHPSFQAAGKTDLTSSFVHPIFTQGCEGMVLHSQRLMASKPFSYLKIDAE